FSDLAETLLGQAQPAQFQSAGQTGYIWGSIYQDADDGNGGRTYSGEKIASTSGNAGTVDGVSAIVNNNANSAIPRTYDHSSVAPATGIAYNWYAAVAESLTFNDVATADDTICPSGWTIPASSTGNTFANLLSNYTLDDGTALGSNDESAKVSMRQPISFAYAGWYYYLNGLYRSGTSRTGYMTKTKAYKHTFYDVRIYVSDVTTNFDFNPLHNMNTSYGVAIRCVKK
ncbi:MAG: hypothetical protein IJI41_13670, partial [Anaerolineaceae bacterium]|nr:hypothetical protein [Anaerolineaceae bacterium]